MRKVVGSSGWTRKMEPGPSGWRSSPTRYSPRPSTTQTIFQNSRRKRRDSLKSPGRSNSRWMLNGNSSEKKPIRRKTSAAFAEDCSIRPARPSVCINIPPEGPQVKHSSCRVRCLSHRQLLRTADFGRKQIRNSRIVHSITT